NGAVVRLAAGSLPLSVSVTGIGVAGERAVIAGSSRLFALRRDGSTIVVEAQLDIEGNPAHRTFEKLLSYDGEGAYLATLEWSEPGSLAVPGVTGGVCARRHHPRHLHHRRPSRIDDQRPRPRGLRHEERAVGRQAVLPPAGPLAEGEPRCDQERLRRQC